MNSFTIDRINRQVKKSIPKKDTEIVIIEDVKPSEPVSLIDLRQIFMEQSEPILPNKENIINFDGLSSFVDWFLVNRAAFSEEQLVPLTTLVQARDIISVGCGCKRKQREEQAENYYIIFWKNNASNDLPKKVLEVGGFSSIVFMSKGVPFLTFPTPEN